MLPVNINYWAVLVAAILSMPVGALWYSPILFAKPWMKETGKKMSEMRGATTGYVLAFVAELITAYVLAHIIQYAQATTLLQGLATAFWVWIGFVATAMAVNYTFEGRSQKLYLITAFHHLAVLLVMGAVLGAWR